MVSNFKNLAAAAIMSIGSALLVSAAGATTFATSDPVGNGANVSLSGLTLNANSTVRFDYIDPSLAAFGDLQATWNLTATETGATAFGPIVHGSFDGAFSYTYTGPTTTVSGHTLHTGDDLLSGSFLGSVFSGYGYKGSLIDSNVAGGIVTYNNNSLLTFNSLADEGFSTALTSITPTVKVISGKLTPFGAVAQNSFSAEYDITTGAPEPAVWSLMIIGVGGMGMALRTRRRAGKAA